MLDLFLKGAKTDLQESDIYQPLKEDDSKKVTDHLEKWVFSAFKCTNVIISFVIIIAFVFSIQIKK